MSIGVKEVKNLRRFFTFFVIKIVVKCHYRRQDSFLSAAGSLFSLINCKNSHADQPDDVLDRWQLNIQHIRSMVECHAILSKWNTADQQERENAGEEHHARSTLQ
jgi:hypothetical protein